MIQCHRCQRTIKEMKYDRLRYIGAGTYLCDQCIKAFEAWVRGAPARTEGTYPESPDRTPQHRKKSGTGTPENGTEGAPSVIR